MPDATMTADEFFRLVDELLTPHMTALGYHRIGAVENDQPMSRAVLASGSSSSASRRQQSQSFLVYGFGFEAVNDEARRLVYPDDPESADELWLTYEPGTGELDMRPWANIARGRVDWDPWTDTGPCSEAEVRRRLAALGRAVADFVRAQN